jgi:hypothetical protein
MAPKRNRKSVGVTTMSFNIQEYLASMRSEQKEDHEALAGEVTLGLSKVSDAIVAHSKSDQEMFNAIEGRLRPIESMRKTFRWGIGTVFVALVGVLAEAGYSHYKPIDPVKVVQDAADAAATRAANTATQQIKEAIDEASRAQTDALTESRKEQTKELTEKLKTKTLPSVQMVPMIPTPSHK